MVLNVFPQFSLDFLLGLDWDTFYYWHRRAIEIKVGKEIPEEEDGKVDSDVFQRRLDRMNKKLAEHEKRKEGIISG